MINIPSITISVLFGVMMASLMIYAFNMPVSYLFVGIVGLMFYAYLVYIHYKNKDE